MISPPGIRLKAAMQFYDFPYKLILKNDSQKSYVR